MTPPRDRFAPPRADVAEIASVDTLLASRPRSVVWACALMVAATALGFVSLLPFVDPPMPGEPVAMAAMLWGVSLAFAVLALWVLRCAWRRRAWARWAVIAIAATGVASSAFMLAEDWTRAPLVAWLGIATAVLEGAAALLLLSGPAARWFQPANGGRR